MSPDQLLKKYPIISDQIDASELKVILQSLAMVLRTDIPGDIVELGCYVGSTSLFLQRLVCSAASKKRLFVYDSFEGLPSKTDRDESPAGMQFTSGSLFATKSQFILQFKKADLPVPIIKKAWFKQLMPEDLPTRIAFAFLDGDYYDSIKTSLQLIDKKLTPGAVVIVDDYHNEALPGAAKAVDEWMGWHRDYHLKTVASLAVITVSPS